MISLNDARKEVMDICGSEFPHVYTTLTLRDWSNKNVISRLKVENGKANYPDIVVAEILTAIRLKKKYTLEEIAEARSYLNLKCSLNDNLSSSDLVRFVNLQKTFSDKKNVTKKAINEITSTKKIRELADKLYYENKKLKIISDYLDEFLKAKREVQNSKYLSVH
jgi:hypothetical protein